MKIAIIGAGATGLTAGYELCKKGFQVSLYEESETVGGLANTFNVGGTELEHYYHHIFTSDTEVTDMAEKLGIGDKMRWREPTNGFYASGKLYPFTSPLDLLSFGEIPFIARVLMGLMVFRSRFIKDYTELEHMSAGEWITKMAGKSVYEKVWKPLIYSKFDIDAQKISAAWIWNKFKLRGSTRGKDITKELLGYMEGSFGLLYRSLENKIIELGGKVNKSSKVLAIQKTQEGILVKTKDGESLYDNVIFTAAPHQLMDICPEITGEYANKLKTIRYKANICLTLELKNSLSKYYWITVADQKLPFVAVIEHTKIMPMETYGSNILYLSRYLDESSPLFNAPDEKITKDFIKGLKTMFPSFKEEDVKKTYIHRARFSQPVVVQRYSELIPEFKTPVGGLYLASMVQIYPEDRGQNYAIRMGREIAGIIAGGK